MQAALACHYGSCSGDSIGEPSEPAAAAPQLAAKLVETLEELRHITAESVDYALPASLLQKTGVSRTVSAGAFSGRGTVGWC